MKFFRFGLVIVLLLVIIMAGISLTNMLAESSSVIYNQEIIEEIDEETGSNFSEDLSYETFSQAKSSA